MSRWSANTVVTILGEGTNLPGCIAAGVLHVAAQAVQFEWDLRSYCDSVIDGNEIRGILNNSTVICANLASHDTDIKAALAQHDVDIKTRSNHTQPRRNQNHSTMTSGLQNSRCVREKW